MNNLLRKIVKTGSDERQVMAERPSEACFIFDQCPALFAKSQNRIFEQPIYLLLNRTRSTT